MTMQAIVTKYFGPTNTLAGRIKASASAGYVFVEYDHSLSQSDNHIQAARKLAEKFDWCGTYVAGGMPDGKGNVFVCIDYTTDSFKIESPPIVRVLFRRDREGEITACFPDDDMTCYTHIGQHSGYSLEWYLTDTKAATPEEYEPLKRELEAAPYNYRLQVIQRHP